MRSELEQRSVALNLMLAQFMSYSLPAVFACHYSGVNRIGFVTAGALLPPHVDSVEIDIKMKPIIQSC